ncbi:MAG: PLP-dependent aminotransferase family protein [Planctomycetota bacterium]
MTVEKGLSRRAHWAGDEPIANVLMAKTLANPELVSLAAGFVDHETLPAEATAQALDQILSAPGTARTALQYGTTIGYPPLREALLNRLLMADRMSAEEMGLSTDQVVVTAGSNQLLYLLGDTLLDPGDVVICGAPSYFVVLGTLGNLGARTVGVEIDEHGLIPEAVNDQLARLKAKGELGRVKLIYVCTYYDNPSGVTVPVERREALLETVRRWSQRGRIHVIEDTAYRELRYYGDDVRSLRSFDGEGDTVIQVGSFSKSYSPGVRIGWGMLPPRLVGPVLSAKGHLDFGSPNLNQVLMATVLEKGLFDPHVETLRETYRQKIDAILGAADEFLAPIGELRWVRPTGGHYVWLRLPETIDTGVSGRLFDRATAEGVLYVPGEFCYPREGQNAPRNMLRLSFAFPSCENIRKGIEALGRAIRQVT